MMENPNQDRIFPTLNAFAEFFAKEIRPAVQRILRGSRLTSGWIRRYSEWLRPSLFGLWALGSAATFFFAYEESIEAWFSISLLSFVLIVYLDPSFSARKKTQASIASEVAHLSADFLGWKIDTRELEIDSQATFEHWGLIDTGRKDWSWSAYRRIGDKDHWLNDLKSISSDDDGKIVAFQGFTISTQAVAGPELIIIVNPISPNFSGLSRVWRKTRWWIRTGELDEVRTGNDEFDEHFVVHANDADAASQVLSYLFLRSILNAQSTLQSDANNDTATLSFAVTGEKLMIAAHTGDNIIPRELDYLAADKADALIHNNFITVEYLIENLMSPLQENLLKLENR